MTGLRYSPLHVTELCGEMQGKFIVGRARLIIENLKVSKDYSRKKTRNRHNYSLFLPIMLTEGLEVNRH